MSDSSDDQRINERFSYEYGPSFWSFFLFEMLARPESSTLS